MSAKKNSKRPRGKYARVVAGRKPVAKPDTSPAKVPLDGHPAHPLADLAPMASPAEIESIGQDIAANGQRDPIVLIEEGGKKFVLDGRNRQAACLARGIAPKYVDFKSSWGDPAEFVKSKLLRRNLTDAQKACVAIGYAEVFEKRAAERKKGVSPKLDSPAPLAQGTPPKHLGMTRGQTLAKLHGETPEQVEIARDRWAKDCPAAAPRELKIKAILAAIFGPDPADAEAERGRAMDQLGKAFGVSPTYLFYAKAVRDGDPKLFREVFVGEKPLAVAHREVKRREKSKVLEAKAQAAPPLSDDIQIVTGDCLEGLPTLPGGKARLVFADPQYNIGIDYGKHARDDRRPDDAYLAECSKWLEEAKRLLTPDGSLFVVCDAAYLADFEVMLGGDRPGLARVAGVVRSTSLPHATIRGLELHRRNVIAWHETFGTYESGNFTKCWRPVLYYTASATNYVFHGDEVLIPSARQAVYGDKRADPAGKVPGNVWEFPRLVGTAAERVPSEFKTQLPVGLVERVIRACTDPGDLVIDPFVGSGTTPAAAAKLGRRFHGFEINPKRAEEARQRVRAELAAARDAKAAKPAK